MASDIFALGLIYTEFLTGAPPPFDAATYHEPATAVRHGEILRIPRAGVDPELADLVDRMLSADPAQRPTIAQVHATLMGLRSTPEPSTPPVPSALRGKGLRAAAPAAPGAAPQQPGRLLGKLVRQAHRPSPPRMSVWRCRVCEGVNHGGRVCATCGAAVPPGEPLRAAVRTRLPARTEPQPRRRCRRPRGAGAAQLPTPEQIRFANRDEAYSSFDDIDITPLPGGCLVSFGPGRRDAADRSASLPLTKWVRYDRNPAGFLVVCDPFPLKRFSGWSCPAPGVRR